jgi:eukaryotic-like serine/threonine-protein kinase
MDAQLKPGVLLRGKWRLDRFLGRGGMSSVYAATHRNGMRGAIKVLHRELHDNETVKKRFMREGYVANKVEHPGSVRVLDDDVTEDGLVFLVMELLEGSTLKKHWIDCDRHMELPVVMEIADQVLDVLESAHKNQIVHRDLKPDNVFILENGSAKVLDFGIARVLEATMAGSADATSSAAMMGTPAFMPPEQALAHWQKVDGRSDLFALAATVYTVLTGRLIHSGSTMPELLIAAATRQVEPIRVAMPELDESVAAVIDRGLRFDIGERWPDARSMRLALLQAKTKIAGNRTVRLVGADVALPESARTVVTPPGTPTFAEAMATVVPSTTPLGSSSRPTLGTPSTPPAPAELQRAVTQAMPAIETAPPAAARPFAKTTPVVQPFVNASPRTMQSASAPVAPNPSAASWEATPVRLQQPMRPEHIAQLAKVTVGHEPSKNNKAIATWLLGGATAAAIGAAVFVLQSGSGNAGPETTASATTPEKTTGASATASADVESPPRDSAEQLGPPTATATASASATPKTSVPSPPPKPRDTAGSHRPGMCPCVEFSPFDDSCLRRKC